jgi:phage terminase large subunit
MAQRGRPKKVVPGKVTLDIGTLQPKQQLFMDAKCRYVSYGGARGGGKTHVLIRKAIVLALSYSGIKILIVRRTFAELEGTIIQPMIKLINSATNDGRPAGDQIASYHSTMHQYFFSNNSTIKFGHLSTKEAIHEYQGQEFDVIFMDEATHFTESQFRMLGACLRGVNKFPKQMHLTCNPGGVGHQWVKRLFITKEYEHTEKAKDYMFIPATVEDNPALMEASPEYIQMLEVQPDDVKAAWRYGDWDAMAGQYFSEFKRELHVFKPFIIPKEWPRYRVFDYGLDMFALYWVAIDFEGRMWVYREFCESGLIVSDAANSARSLTPNEEYIQYTVAPPDMWSTQKDTGRTMAEIFTQNGLGLVKASNSRIQGWLWMKEMLKVRSDGKPGLMISEDCPRLIRDIPALQHDEKNPSDVATEPHEYTHSPDAIRYFCTFRAMSAEREPVRENWRNEEELEEYDDFMTGGVVSDGYLAYGG